MNPSNAHKLAKAIFADPVAETPGGLPAIAGYTLIREIGRGGGGVVYEGISEATDRPVAIKFLHTKGRKPAAQALHEIDRLADVRSSVVPHVFEHGWADGRMYMVTELIKGVDLRQYAAPLDLRAKAELLIRIADAVGVLNERGIIHRDLKPSNILITKDGNPVIVDLGIAMLLGAEGDDELNTPGEPVGTLAYMAPEQAGGENAEVSTRWDVYALGAIGYELLTGSTPHELAPTITQSIRRVQKDEPRPARQLNPDLPVPLAHILEHACAFDPEARYASAQLMREDYARWLRREPVSVGPQTLLMKLARFTARHPVATVAAMCAFIAISSLTAISTLIWWQNTQPYRFLHSADEKGSITSIVSRSERVLHTWETIEPEGITFRGKILEADGERYAVIGFKYPEMTTGVTGLAGYKLGEYDTPAWIAQQRVPDELMYAARHEPRPHLFVFHRAFLFDVFPDADGIEVLSISRHSKWSPTVVQIRRANGELLSEFAHDGELNSLYWEPVNRLLYCVGQNSDGTWEDRGSSGFVAGKYPVIIFAVRPELEVQNALIEHPGITGTMKPLWYRCVLPGKHYNRIGGESAHLWSTLTLPSRVDEQLAGCVDLELGVRYEPESVNMVVEPDGELRRAWATDNWSANTGLDPTDFWLGELPPRTIERIFTVMYRWVTISQCSFRMKK